MTLENSRNIELRSFGEGTPVYQVLEKKPNTVKIQMVESGEIVEDYPLFDFENDPVVK